MKFLSIYGNWIDPDEVAAVQPMSSAERIRIHLKSGQFISISFTKTILPGELQKLSDDIVEAMRRVREGEPVD